MEDQKLTYVFIGIVWFAMFGLFIVFTVLYLKYRNRIQKKEDEKKMATFKASIEAEERQKQRIAADLHDEVAALIHGVIYGIDESIINISKGVYGLDSLKRSKDVAIQLHDKIKAVSLELMPTVLIEVGAVRALGKHLENISTTSCVVKLKNETPFDGELPFEKNIEVHIYRVCLELINNLKKHDNITYLEVIISRKENSLVITLDHDGKGITNEQIKPFSNTINGLGLKSIDSRLKFINGKVNYYVEARGPRIELEIPFIL